MDKQEIIRQLQTNHESFISCVASLDEEAFKFSKEGKWNAGQTLDHIYRAVSTLSMGMMVPKFMFGWLFGKANRPSKKYEELVAKYKGKLAEGGKAHGRYLPSKVSFSNQETTAAALRKSVDNICKKLSTYSEGQMDEYRIPHPLLGKLSIREMMYFTIYHAEHHRQIVLRDSKMAQEERFT